MDEKIYDNYLYLDTNIISHICKNKTLVKPLYNYLVENNLSVAISGASIAELHDAKFLHDILIERITADIENDMGASFDDDYFELWSNPTRTEGGEIACFKEFFAICLNFQSLFIKFYL